MTLTDRAQFQKRALAHYKGAHRAHVRAATERPLTDGERRARRWYRAAIGWTSRELAETRALLIVHLSPVAAIIHAFGRWAYQAIRVARCESHLSIYAHNGIYLGLFQVSSHWRRTIPGFAFTAIAQALHAFRVFAATGYSWAHWECKP